MIEPCLFALNVLASLDPAPCPEKVLYVPVPEVLPKEMAPGDAVLAVASPASPDLVRFFFGIVTPEQEAAYANICATAVEASLREQGLPCITNGALLNENLLDRKKSVPVEAFPVDGSAPLSVIWASGKGHVVHSFILDGRATHIAGSATTDLFFYPGWIDIALRRIHASRALLSCMAKGEEPSTVRSLGKEFEQGPEARIAYKAALAVMRASEKRGIAWSAYRRSTLSKKDWMGLAVDFDPCFISRFPYPKECEDFVDLAMTVADFRRNAQGRELAKDTLSKDVFFRRVLDIMENRNPDVFFTTGLLSRIVPGCEKNPLMREFSRIMGKMPLYGRVSSGVQPFAVSITAERFAPHEEPRDRVPAKVNFLSKPPHPRDPATSHLSVIRLTVGMQYVFPRLVGGEYFCSCMSGVYNPVPGFEGVLYNPQCVDIPLESEEGIEECVERFFEK